MKGKVLNLKKNRSNKYTTGLVITNKTNDQRFLFFELDKPINPDDKYGVIDVYRRYGLDLLIHRTGDGIHFISPTPIDVETWKKAMKLLKNINKKCPMTTLRWLPNKHPNEEQIWYSTEHWYHAGSNRGNSDQLSKLLNKQFNSSFEGIVDTDLKFVRYPLP